MATQRPPDSDNAAQAVRDLGEMLASALAGSGTAAPARTIGRRYAAVADQMMASLDAYGLPHDGVQLALNDDEAPARARLIEGLKRNFAFKDEDGYRTYFRSRAQPVARDDEADSRLLRGAALVNATAVRAAADGILTAIDQLPDLDRFVPAYSRRAALRDRIERVLRQLTDTASDATGINVPRGRVLVDRLRVSVAELVTESGLLPRHVLADFLQARSQTAMEDPFAGRDGNSAKDRSPFEQLRDRVSAVRNEEIRATTLALFQLVDRIADVVTEPSAGMDRGLNAARLEELLGAAYLSAVALEEDMSRAGTSVIEQSVQFFTPQDSTDRISVGQYLGWVRAVCEPFTAAANDSADLLYDEAGTLAAELTSLASYADALARCTAPRSACRASVGS
jgi:hypothetical protein